MCKFPLRSDGTLKRRVFRDQSTVKTPRLPRIPVYWVCQAAGWFGLAALNCLDTRLLWNGDFRIVWTSLANALVAILLTHLLRGTARRRHWTELRIFGLLWRVLPAVAVIAGVRTVGSWWVGSWIGIEEWTSGALPLICLASWAVAAVETLGWCSFYFGYQYYAQHQQSRVDAARLAQEAREAHLRMLRTQLNPHFLFNALNSIRALIGLDPERGREAVTSFSNLLRKSFQRELQPFVRLAEEMQIVEDYLAIEEIRFEERLKIIRNLDPASLDHAVPPFLVQTLVENAVKHGIDHLPRGGWIRIESGLRCDDTLVIRVSNPHPLRSDRQTIGTGTGLVNAREHLRLLMGAGATLTLAEAEGIVTAEAVVPFMETKNLQTSKA